MTALEQALKQIADLTARFDALTARVDRIERAPLPANHPPPAPTPWAKDVKGGAA